MIGQNANYHLCRKGLLFKELHTNEPRPHSPCPHPSPVPQVPIFLMFPFPPRPHVPIFPKSPSFHVPKSPSPPRPRVPMLPVPQMFPVPQVPTSASSSYPHLPAQHLASSSRPLSSSYLHTYTCTRLHTSVPPSLRAYMPTFLDMGCKHVYRRVGVETF